MLSLSLGEICIFVNKAIDTRLENTFLVNTKNYFISIYIIFKITCNYSVQCLQYFFDIASSSSYFQLSIEFEGKHIFRAIIETITRPSIKD